MKNQAAGCDRDELNFYDGQVSAWLPLGRGLPACEWSASSITARVPHHSKTWPPRRGFCTKELAHRVFKH